jgi:hypothetical protein
MEVQTVITINIAKDFTKTPGARYKADGPFSGEEFRETFLEKYFDDIGNQCKITVILDGAEGYATSFLEEAFGGLARKYGKKRCLERLEFISNEDRLLIDEIKMYIGNSNEKK